MRTSPATIYMRQAHVIRAAHLLSQAILVSQLLSARARTAAAHSPMPGYALPMTNPYGITLDRVWTEWAAEYGVSPTVAAALFLISVHRPAHEVAAKLTACEFKQVTDIVRRWPNNFASGTLAALETQKHAAQRELTTSTSTMWRPVGPVRGSRPALRTRVEPTNAGSKAFASTLLRRLLSLSALAHLSLSGSRTPKKPGHIPGRLLIFFDGAWWSKT